MCVKLVWLFECAPKYRQLWVSI